MTSISLRPAHQNELSQALDLLREAALSLKAKHIDQWQFWLDPPKEKTDWVKEGFRNNEFHFIEFEGKLAGMVRLMSSDLLYWGQMIDEAQYVHSLVIRKAFAGKQLGVKVLDHIATNMINNGIYLLRLDCNAANKKLCDYYERYGFIKVGEKQMPHSLNALYQKLLTS